MFITALIGGIVGGLISSVAASFIKNGKPEVINVTNCITKESPPPEPVKYVINAIDGQSLLDFFEKHKDEIHGLS